MKMSLCFISNHEEQEQNIKIIKEIDFITAFITDFLH